MFFDLLQSDFTKPMKYSKNINLAKQIRVILLELQNS